MSTKNLLVELLVEELPPKSLKKLGEVFSHWIRQGLIDALLVSAEEKWEWFASPRRLAVRINNVEHNNGLDWLQINLCLFLWHMMLREIPRKPC